MKRNTVVPSTHIQFSLIVSYFLIFVLGLGLGITFSFFYFKDDSIDSQLDQLSAFPASSIPLPLPPPPPSSTSPSIVYYPIDQHLTQSIPTNDRDIKQEFIEPPPTRHNMTDDELFWRASLVPRIPEFPIKRIPKIAFMFLTKREVLLAPLWEMFFRGHQGLYSIYVHSDPSFVPTMPSYSVFYDRWIPSKVARWGEMNMVEAERRLLANALLDISNERFILISESCIPLFNFSTIYDYIIQSSKSFVESYDLPGPVGRGRYNVEMSPWITIEQWRKGSQWFEIDRFLAVEVIIDQTYITLFWQYCRGSCYGDEHYLPTLIDMKFPDRGAYRTLTYVDWSMGGPHPTSFRKEEVTEDFLNNLRNFTDCYDDERAVNICYLFARKFSPNTLGKLLRLAPNVMHY